MQPPLVRLVLLAALALAAVLSGCAQPPEKPNRIETTLGRDGYALFRVDGGGADRVAVIIEMRNAPPGTYVLLHTGNAPQSSGWFALDTAVLAPCREYGKDAVERAELDCLVADGRGELVDLITIADDMILLPTADGTALPSTPWTTLMRHEMCGCSGCQCSYQSTSSSSSSSSSSRTTARASESDYYAVMRIEGGLVDVEAGAIPFAIEVRPFGEDDEDADPTVTQVQ